MTRRSPPPLPGDGAERAARLADHGAHRGGDEIDALAGDPDHRAIGPEAVFHTASGLIILRASLASLFRSLGQKPDAPASLGPRELAAGDDDRGARRGASGRGQL